MENNQLYNQANTCEKLVAYKKICPGNDGLQQTAYQTPMKQKKKRKCKQTNKHITVKGKLNSNTSHQ